MCTILTLVAEHGMKLRQINIKTTFLNGPLEEEIYMQAIHSWYRLLETEERSIQLKAVWQAVVSRAKLEAQNDWAQMVGVRLERIYTHKWERSLIHYNKRG